MKNINKLGITTSMRENLNILIWQKGVGTLYTWNRHYIISVRLYVGLLHICKPHIICHLTMTYLASVGHWGCPQYLRPNWQKNGMSQENLVEFSPSDIPYSLHRIASTMGAWRARDFLKGGGCSHKAHS